MMVLHTDTYSENQIKESIENNTCVECKKSLEGINCTVRLTSGRYCPDCYDYWYAYKNKRFTKDQAMARNLCMWPIGFIPNTGKIEFAIPTKKQKERYGIRWNKHPDDWKGFTRRFLAPSEILIDGVNFP